MKFEVGKKYILRNGNIVIINDITKPDKYIIGSELHQYDNDNFYIFRDWFSAGNFYIASPSDLDIVKEYQEAEEKPYIEFNGKKWEKLTRGSHEFRIYTDDHNSGNHITGAVKHKNLWLDGKWDLKGKSYNHSGSSYDIIPYKEPKSSDKGDCSSMNPTIKGFTAFWEYDKFPYCLSGVVDGINENGTVFVKQYMSSFKPIVMMPSESAKKIEDKLSQLKLDFANRREDLKSEFMEEVRLIAPFIKQGE